MEDQPAPKGQKQIGRAASSNPNTIAAGFSFDKYAAEELIGLYDEIRERLPPLQLEKMSVEEELLLQFHVIRRLQTAVMDDDEVAANQKAQVANAVSSSLNKVAELQIKIYDSERFKNIETMLIRHLSKLPEDIAAAFLADYEKLYAKGQQ